MKYCLHHYSGDNYFMPPAQTDGCCAVAAFFICLNQDLQDVRIKRIGLYQLAGFTLANPSKTLIALCVVKPFRFLKPARFTRNFTG